MLSKSFGISDPGRPVAVDLARLMEILCATAREVESAPAESELLFARLSDAMRAIGADPPEERAWLSACHGVSRFRAPSEEVAPAARRALQLNDWRRLHLLLESLREPAIGELVARRRREWGSERDAGTGVRRRRV